MYITHTYLCAYKYVYTYIYTYIFTYTFTHIYIYIYIYPLFFRFCSHIGLCTVLSKLPVLYSRFLIVI